MQKIGFALNNSCMLKFFSKTIVIELNSIVARVAQW